jgi:hypothetical protein
MNSETLSSPDAVRQLCSAVQLTLDQLREDWREMRTQLDELRKDIAEMRKEFRDDVAVMLGLLAEGRESQPTSPVVAFKADGVFLPGGGGVV